MTRVVNKRLDPYDIYIGRGSDWGNYAASTKPNTFGIPLVASKDEAIEAYRQALLKNTKLLRQLYLLKDKVLGCTCAPKGGLTRANKPYCCHGQVLAELADAIPSVDDGRIAI